MRETAQALRAFMLYRDMGPDRSLEKVYQAHADSIPKVPTLKLWSMTHHWQDRVRAHDQAIADESARRDQEARVADADKRRKDRLSIALSLRGIGVKVLTEWHKEGGITFLLDDPAAVIRILDQADRTERLDTGQPTERFDVSRYSDEELTAAYVELRRVREHRSGDDPA